MRRLWKTTTTTTTNQLLSPPAGRPKHRPNRPYAALSFEEARKTAAQRVFLHRRAALEAQLFEQRTRDGRSRRGAAPGGSSRGGGGGGGGGGVGNNGSHNNYDGGGNGYGYGDGGEWSFAGGVAPPAQHQQQLLLLQKQNAARERDHAAVSSTRKSLRQHETRLKWPFLRAD